MGIKISLLRLSIFCLSGTIALSGCISSDIASDISPVAAIDSPQTMSNLSSGEAVPGSEELLTTSQSSDVLPTNGIPIPSSAPRPVLAMNAESTVVTQPAVQQAEILAAGVEQNQNTQIAAATPVPVASPISETAVATLNAPIAASAVSSAPPESPRKLSFFEQWRKNVADQKESQLAAKKIRDEQLKVARLKTAVQQKTSNNSALPGVKKGDSLFGIDESSGDEEESANVVVASIGGFARSLVARGLVLQTSNVQVQCFKPELMQVLKVVERKYGRKVMVTSGYRSPERNRRAGGVSNSSHVYCKAADIQVVGVSKWDLAKFLRTIPGRGGVGTYCRTKSVHIDVGSQRDWHHPCRRTKSKKRKS